MFLLRVVSFWVLFWLFMNLWRMLGGGRKGVIVKLDFEKFYDRVSFGRSFYYMGFRCCGGRWIRGFFFSVYFWLVLFINGKFMSLLGI